MTILFWIGLFILSLMVLVKGADWFLASSEKFGLAKGISKFVVGVVIVGIGTSLPELFSSIVAVWSGAPEIVVANAIGSNVANILLIVGVSVVMAGKLVTTKYLIDIDIPLLVIATSLFVVSAWDGVVTRGEAILLILAFVFYLIYSIKEGKDQHEEETNKRPIFTKKDAGFMLAGLLGLIFGSKYLIESVISLSDIMNISTGAISLAAVAVGTSLPELLVSVKAALRGKSEVALGNIFGSNIFNLLMVVGLPALFTNIPLDTVTYTVGLPFLAIVTLLFTISGISQRMYMWEGAMYIILYVFFIGKLFNFF